METIQLTLDESLLIEVQQATKALQMTRSDFFKLAFERALRQRKTIELENSRREGLCGQSAAT